MRARFPLVSGANLERREYSLPRDFEGERNLVLIAFWREQQEDVDTWMPLARRLAAETPGLRYYELPTISRLLPVGRWWLDRVMRAGISDPEARTSTITLYLDKRAFREALRLPTEDRIYALLVTRSGEVLWRAEGPLTEEKENSLRATLAGAASVR